MLDEPINMMFLINFYMFLTLPYIFALIVFPVLVSIVVFAKNAYKCAIPGLFVFCVFLSLCDWLVKTYKLPWYIVNFKLYTR